MTSAEAKAYLTRARDAERDIVLLDDDHRWAMDSIANLKRIQSHNDLAPAIDRLKHYARHVARKRPALIRLREEAAARIDRDRVAEHHPFTADPSFQRARLNLVP